MKTACQFEYLDVVLDTHSLCRMELELTLQDVSGTKAGIK